MFIKRMYTCFITLIICITISGCYMFTKSDTYYGIETKGKNIVFLVDISGSMEGKNEGNFTDKMRAQAMREASSGIGNLIGGTAGSVVSGAIDKEATKLGSAKRELEPAIRGLTVDCNFTIITFESKVKKWNKTLVPASDGNKTKAIFYVKRLSSKGGTSALAGLKAAFRLKNVNMIFFLSDGYPSDGSRDKILEEVKKLNSKRKVVINTIGLGDDKDEQFMEDLADQNGGKYLEK